MDHDTFDNVARTIAGSATRRRFGALVIAAGAGLRVFGPTAVEAKPKKKRKQAQKRRKPRNQQPQPEQPQSDPPAQPQSPPPNPPPPPEQPVCVPFCLAKSCGPNGCGGFCGNGNCGLLEACVNGVCEPSCITSCGAKECGPRCPGGPEDECGVCPGVLVCKDGKCPPLG